MSSIIFRFACLCSFAALLAACDTPQISAQTHPVTVAVSTNTQTSSPTTPSPVTPTLLITVQTTSPTSAATPAPLPILQPGNPIRLNSFQMMDAQNGWGRGSALGMNPPQKDYFGQMRDYDERLLHTRDRGRTWNDVTPPWFLSVNSKTYLFGAALFALDGNTAWAMPDGDTLDNPNFYSGTVWFTTDGGNSWKPGNPFVLAKPRTSDMNNSLGGDPFLQFVDAKNGWLKSNIDYGMGYYDTVFMRTTDGGMNWEPFPSICSRGVCPNPVFLDENTGWIRPHQGTGQGPECDDLAATWKVQKTTNGGRTWEEVVLPPPSNSALKPNTEKEQNRSFNFTLQRVGAHSVSIRVNCSFFANTFTYISNNGGQSWRIFSSAGDFFLNDTLGWRFSAENPQVLEKTTDGGVAWQKLADNLPGNGGDIQFIDANTGWLLIQSENGAHFLGTADGGLTWTELAPHWQPLKLISSASVPATSETAIPEERWLAHLDAGSLLRLASIDMMDESSGWAVDQNKYIFHTQDGGETWQDVTPRYGGKRGYFLALDSLRAWNEIFPLPECYDKRLLSQCPDYYLTHGEIWFTDDGGQSWRPTGKFPDIAYPIEHSYGENDELQFFNPLSGWAQLSTFDNVSQRRTLHLFQTENGGLTWNARQMQLPAGYARVIFINQQVGFYYTGSEPTIIRKTTDGGITWEPLTLPQTTLSTNEIHVNEKSFYLGLEPHTYGNSSSSVELQFIPPNGISLKLGYAIEDPVNPEKHFHFYKSYLSADEGQSWKSWIAAGNEFFLDSNTGWLLSPVGADQPTYLKHTTNGGQTWKTLKNVAWQEAQLDFVNELTGWAVISNDNVTTLVHTNDGGQTWIELNPKVTP